jgi:hypothetical protein
MAKKKVEKSLADEWKEAERNARKEFEKLTPDEQKNTIRLY